MARDPDMADEIVALRARVAELLRETEEQSRRLGKAGRDKLELRTRITELDAALRATLDHPIITSRAMAWLRRLFRDALSHPPCACPISNVQPHTSVRNCPVHGWD